MPRQLLFVLLCSLLGPAGVWAQQKITLKHYTQEDGLADHRVMDVLEHSNGFTYVATHGGLDRFDGYSFQHIQLPKRAQYMNGSIGPMVRKLQELEDGRILIMYQVNGQSKSVPIDVYNLDLQNQDSLMPIETSREPKGKSHKYYAVEKDTVHFYTSPNIWANYHTLPRSFQDRQGHSIRLSEQGNSIHAMLYFAEGDSLDLSAYWQSFESYAVPRGANFKNHVYVATQFGLMKLELEPVQFKRYLNLDVQPWTYGTKVRGIDSLDADHIMVSVEKLSDKPEPMTDVWGKGLAIINTKTDAITYPTIIDPKKQYFFSSDMWRMFPLAGHEVLGVHRTGGFQTFDLNSMKGIGPRGNKSYISDAVPLDQDHFFAIGYVSGKGINLITYDATSRTQQFTPLDIPDANSNTIFCMTRNSSGRIWAGCEFGVFELDPETKQVVSHITSVEAKQQQINANMLKILNSAKVFSLYSSQDELWIGTDRGISVFNLKTQDLKTFGLKDGLPNDVITGMLPMNGKMWVSTFYGLSELDTATRTSANYFLKDGIAHNEFNRGSFLEWYDGSLFFGGMNGVTRVMPNQEKQDIKNTLLLCEASYFKSDTYVKEAPSNAQPLSFILPPQHRNIRFLFSIDHGQRIDETRYLYQLLDANEQPDEGNWVNNGTNRELDFKALPVGDYDLFVKAVNANAQPTEPKKISLHIGQFFYQTWWFIALLIIVPIAIAFGFFRVRLAQRVKMERLRVGLSSDLHDDVGSLLSGIAFQMELFEHTVDDEHKDFIRQIKELSRRAMWQMRDVVWAVDSRKGTMADLTDRMKEHIQEVVGPAGIHVRIDEGNLNLTARLSSEFRHSVIMIFKEFITNTLKHADASRVDVSMRMRGQNFTLYMKDNGSGPIDLDAAKTGSGLRNMHLRAKKLKGNLRFTADSGFGIKLKCMIS